MWVSVKMNTPRRRSMPDRTMIDPGSHIFITPCSRSRRSSGQRGFQFASNKRPAIKATTSRNTGRMNGAP